mmetsp:Transcript_9497/g.22835  ORF Transcript_9497/g.22835 Transcript_9497/m.22835 type:complete len:301 (+) Transcript_9497:1132-2034(+)
MSKNSSNSLSMRFSSYWATNASSTLNRTDSVRSSSSPHALRARPSLASSSTVRSASSSGSEGHSDRSESCSDRSESESKSEPESPSPSVLPCSEPEPESEACAAGRLGAGGLGSAPGVFEGVLGLDRGASPGFGLDGFASPCVSSSGPARAVAGSVATLPDERSIASHRLRTAGSGAGLTAEPGLSSCPSKRATSSSILNLSAIVPTAAKNSSAQNGARRLGESRDGDGGAPVGHARGYARDALALCRPAARAAAQHGRDDGDAQGSRRAHALARLPARAHLRYGGVQLRGDARGGCQGF